MLVLMEEGRFEGLPLVCCILISISEWHLESSKDIILTLNQRRLTWAHLTVSVDFLQHLLPPSPLQGVGLTQTTLIAVRVFDFPGEERACQG